MLLFFFRVFPRSCHFHLHVSFSKSRPCTSEIKRLIRPAQIAMFRDYIAVYFPATWRRELCQGGGQKYLRFSSLQKCSPESNKVEMNISFARRWRGSVSGGEEGDKQRRIRGGRGVFPSRLHLIAQKFFDSDDMLVRMMREFPPRDMPTISRSFRGDRKIRGISRPWRRNTDRKCREYEIDESRTTFVFRTHRDLIDNRESAAFTLQCRASAGRKLASHPLERSTRRNDKALSLCELLCVDN